MKAEHLWTEKHKTLMKETEEDTNQWEMSYLHELKELMLKMFITLKEIYRFHSPPTKFKSHVHINVKNNLKINMVPQKTMNSQISLEKMLETSHFLI